MSEHSSTRLEDWAQQQQRPREADVGHIERPAIHGGLLMLNAERSDYSSHVKAQASHKELGLRADWICMEHHHFVLLALQWGWGTRDLIEITERDAA